MSLGNRLKEARNQKNLTQNDAAKQLGITFQALSNYERDVRDPDTTLLKKMAELYEVTADQLLGCNNIRENPRFQAAHTEGDTPITEESLNIIEAELKKIREELKRNKEK